MAKVPFRERYATSRQIFREAWRLVRLERDLWRVPFAATGLLLALIAIVVVVMRATDALDVFAMGPVAPVLVVLVAIVATLPLTFLSALLNGAYLFGLHERMEGRAITPRQAWQRAWSRKGAFARFTLLAALVGGVLAIVGQLLNKLRLVPYVGTAVEMMGTFGWAVASFFVVPAIVVEGERRAVGALRTSVGLAREQWGRTTAGLVTIGLAMMVPLLLLMALFFVAFFGGIAWVAAGRDGNPLVLAMVVGFVFLAATLVLQTIAQMATVAYQTALYRYARTGIVSLPFTPETVVDAWEPYRR